MRFVSQGLRWMTVGMVLAGMGVLPLFFEVVGGSTALAEGQPLNDLTVDSATRLRLSGEQYLQQGRYKDALTMFQGALRGYESKGDLGGQAAILNGMGTAYTGIFEYTKMGEVYQKALTLARKSYNRQEEGIALNGIGDIYFYQSNYDKALESVQQALSLCAEPANLKCKALSLRNIGDVYRAFELFPKALFFYKQALPLLKAVGDYSSEVVTLNNIGSVYSVMGKYQKALEYYNQALPLVQALGNLGSEVITLNNIGFSHSETGKKQKALVFYNQAIPLLQALSDRNGAANNFRLIGNVYSDLEEHQNALDNLNRSLSLWKALNDTKGEASTLNNIGLVYSDMEENQKALVYLNRSLSLWKTLNDTKGEASTLNNIGLVYSDMEENQKALVYLNRSLPLRKLAGDHSGEAVTLNNIGKVYHETSENKRALELYNQALPLLQEPSDSIHKVVTLINIGEVYSELGQNNKALDYFNQALSLSKAMGRRSSIALTLNNIGEVYSELGQNNKALNYFNQALSLSKAMGNRSSIALALNNIGKTYSDLGRNKEALEFHIQALSLRRVVGNRISEAISLNNIGFVYKNLGDNRKALDYLNQALPLLRARIDVSLYLIIRNNIGKIYFDLGEKQKALTFYNQALPLLKALGNRRAEAIALSNMGYFLLNQNQITLAIVFYKQSINTTESLRNDIKGLPKETQQIYAQTVAHRYRTLANLLLQQGRIVEALQVLDLLKAQELQDFLKDVKGNDRTAQGIELLPEEQQILSKLNAPTIPDLNTYLSSPAVNTLVQQLQNTAAAQNLKLNAYHDLQTRLQALGTRSSLLYPLILDDRIELVLLTPNAPPVHRTVPVSKTELSKAIFDFRGALQDPHDTRTKTFAQKLHSWLILPLEADLKQSQTQTIIYAPDGILRYAPLAALYDGQHWMAETYQINYVTAFALTSLKPSSSQAPHILAAAFTDPQGSTVTVNQQQIQFGPIPGALIEVKSLSSQFPQTTLLLDKAFNHKTMTSSNMNVYGIIHLATHGKLVGGNPEDSFILLNNGEYVTLRELKDWQLSNVDLVILSACQTALAPLSEKPAENQASGIEILGFGYQLQLAQAKAAIASLWEVNDEGTQVLMNAFYEALKQGKTKTEALREAQEALINGKKTAGTATLPKALIDATPNPSTRAMNRAAPSFSHPYYWAPFILIGNGL
jgi:CHAT domain-containing protein/Tfp pilus assembly protein PilF